MPIYWGEDADQLYDYGLAGLGLVKNIQPEDTGGMLSTGVLRVGVSVAAPQGPGAPISTTGGDYFTRSIDTYRPPAQCVLATATIPTSKVPADFDRFDPQRGYSLLAKGDQTRIS